MADTDFTDYSDTSGSEYETEAPAFQQFVEKRGNKIDMDNKFYVALRLVKGKKGLLKALTGQPDQPAKPKPIKYALSGTLPDPRKETMIKAGEGKVIPVDSLTEYWPVEKANKLFDENKAKKVTLSLPEQMEEELTVQNVLQWEDRATSDMVFGGGPSTSADEVPSQLIRINVSNFNEGMLQKGEQAYSAWNGFPLVRLGCGKVLVFVPERQTWELGKEEHFQIVSAKRRKQFAAARYEKKLQELEAEVEDLTAKLAEKEMALEAASSCGSSEESFVYEISSKTTKIFDYKKATQLSLISRLPVFEVKGTLSAREWLNRAVRRLRYAGIDHSIAAMVLETRLGDEESLSLEAILSDDDDLVNFSVFCEKFLERFGSKESPMALLRGLQKAKMTSDQVTKLEFLEFGTGLERTAERCYRKMCIRRELWPELNRVLVLSAFMQGVPPEVTEHLLVQECESLEVSYKKARDFLQAKRFANKSKEQASVGYVKYKKWQGRGNQPPSGPNQQRNNVQNHNNTGATGGGNAKQRPQQASRQGQSHGRGQRPNQEARQSYSQVLQGETAPPADLLCTDCRNRTNPPDACDHCRKCKRRGHNAKECPDNRNPSA